MVIDRADGTVLFRLYLPEAGGVQILGDFTGWREGPIAMRRKGDGWWEAESAIGPGDYLFSYLVDGERWLPDYAAHGIRANRYGGWVSQLSVQSSLATLHMAA